MNTFIIPKTKNRPEIVFELGKWYTTDTIGDFSMPRDFLYQVVNIDDNGAHVITLSGIKRVLKSRTRFVVASKKADKKNVIKNIFQYGKDYYE